MTAGNTWETIYYYTMFKLIKDEGKAETYEFLVIAPYSIQTKITCTLNDDRKEINCITSNKIHQKNRQKIKHDHLHSF